MSATGDMHKLKSHFEVDDRSVVSLPGHTFPVQIYHSNGPVSDYIAAARDRVANHVLHGSGDVLVFLPGQDDCIDLLSHLRGHLAPHLVQVSLLLLYRDLPVAEQSMVFEPTPNLRKIVLATNIAETSLTLADLKLVIDTGLAKVAQYDAANGMDRLLLSPISKASATQRAGRVGRTSPGTVMRLYTAAQYAQFETHTRPAILRSPFTETLLKLTVHGVRSMAEVSLPGESIVPCLC